MLLSYFCQWTRLFSNQSCPFIPLSESGGRPLSITNGGRGQTEFLVWYIGLYEWQLIREGFKKKPIDSVIMIIAGGGGGGGGGAGGGGHTPLGFFFIAPNLVVWLF